MKVYFHHVGNDTVAMPNIMMNSLVSPTKVVTNDSIPNPIASTHSNISLPSVPVPVSSLGIPMTTMKSQDDEDTTKPIEIDKMEEKTFSDSDTIDAEEGKSDDSKKDVEPMPVEVEDESIIQMASKIEGNIAESDDVEVTESASEPIVHNSKAVQNEIILANGNGKSDENGGNFVPQSNNVEPMECASANSIASPKHNMVTDVIMSESGSVSPSTHSFRLP